MSGQPPAPRWHWPALSIGLPAGLLLFGSWLWPVTRGLWDGLDRAIFFTLNGSLADRPLWQAFWAVANWRPSDLISASLILIIGFVWIYRSPLDVRLPRLSGLGVLLAVILITRITAGFILYLTDYSRHSPSLVLEPSIRLNALVEWIETKDAHKDCFPGDHGYVVISCIVFFFLQAGKRWGLWSFIILAPFMLPRLISGAHWATDILIGSGFMALISLPLLFATPMYVYGVRALSWILNKLFRPVLSWLRLR